MRSKSENPVLPKGAEPTTRIVPDDKKICTGRDLAAVLAPTIDNRHFSSSKD
jgi:hypothetical protein